MTMNLLFSISLSNVTISWIVVNAPPLVVVLELPAVVTVGFFSLVAAIKRIQMESPFTLDRETTCHLVF